MLFNKKHTPVFRSEQPPTPFDLAKREWDQRIGAPVVQGKNWRFAFFCAAILAAGAMGGWYHQSTLSTVETLIVYSDRQTGEYSPPVAANFNVKPEDTEVIFTIRNWLKWVRTKPSDKFVIRQNWLDAYKFLMPNAAKKLTSYAQQNDPFGKIGEDTRAIDIETIFRRSDGSFEARWIERRFTNGTLTRTDHYSGLFSPVFKTPSKKQNAVDNPRGIFFEDFNWNLDRQM